MTSPIISVDVAHRLNEIIQNTLDSRLFLFCNYEPTNPPAVSEEGKYLVAVQDLYKFAIDSSCILKKYDDYLPFAFRPSYSRIGEIVAFIGEVRTAIDHNRSDDNGWFEQNSIEYYTQWMLKVIGKDVPDCEEDYAQLNLALEAIANELIRVVERFANHFSSRTDKEKVINCWVNETLRWYTQTSKSDIYRGQMVNAYVARIVGEGRSIQDWSRKTMFERTSRWISNLYFYPIQEKKDKLVAEIKALELALSPENPKADILFSRLSDAQKETVKEKLIQELESKKKERKEITRQLTNSSIPNPDKKFFTDLGKQIKETMDILEQKGISYSLLPQSILQEDIERVFSRVPVPEY